MKRKTGEYRTISTVGGETARAFIPFPLPPKPDIINDPKLIELEDNALLSLGRLDSVSTLLPDTSLFLYMYVRKEAVLSSQIEGTQSSLSDLLLFESESVPGVPIDDVQEVSNYVAALTHGMKRIRGGFPLSLRLMKEIHEVLLSKGRGKDKTPGEFRRSQNWIGGSRPGNARFVPPPPGQLVELMGELEKFLHDKPTKSPVLIKAALSHVQFETIHPFLDGNGRLGRLLITLLLCAEGALTEPLLYLSLYFKSHRDDYYSKLQSVRVDGDWEAWLKFFLVGVKETAEQAVTTAQKLVRMFEIDRVRIQEIGRGAGSALRVHHFLQNSPIVSISAVAKKTKLSFPTAKSSLDNLQKLGIVSPLPKKGRTQFYCYNKYVALLSQGTEPF
ncbi:MAG TPA: Fic family protein [candidate division Zixibacteria bacterium]|nr:Fic family protein [candidate division Zixibacteria bacterium]